MKDIVVIPTYNERENIEPMIQALGETVPQADVLVCDDASPDGTGELVLKMAEINPKIHLSPGPPKGGLGPAYIRGFKWTLDHGYDRIAQMDCDFSHDPQTVPLLFRALEEHDFALGSRYVLGGKTVNWPWYRRALSRGGSLYARTILGVTMRDVTGGFKAWRRETLEAMDLSKIISNGYSFLIEMNYYAVLQGKSFVQIPITFVDRRVGQTKMSKTIFLEAVSGVWKMRFNQSKYL